jgi:hypothetical protein
MDQDARMAQRRHLYVRLRCLTMIFQIDLEKDQRGREGIFP